MAEQGIDRLASWAPTTELDAMHTLLFIGSSGSGKSTLTKKLLYEMKDKFYAAVAFCGNREVMDDMAMMLHPSMIHYGFDEDKVHSILRRGEVLMGSFKDTGEVRPLLVILEDIAALDKQILKCKALASIVNQGRHQSVCVWVLCQHWKQTHADTRTGFSDMVLCKEDSDASRKNIHGKFGCGALSYPQFKQAMDGATPNYGALVVRNRAPIQNGIMDQVRSYRVTRNEYQKLQQKSFRVGHFSVWQELYRYQSLEMAKLSALQHMTQEMQEFQKRQAAMQSGALPMLQRTAPHRTPNAFQVVPAAEVVFDDEVCGGAVISLDMDAYNTHA
jgi:GTPase SAR1 family protein